MSHQEYEVECGAHSVSLEAFSPADHMHAYYLLNLLNLDSDCLFCLQVMVANIRCNEIKLDQLRCFEADQAWQSLVAEGQNTLVRGFAQRAGALRESCVQG